MADATLISNIASGVSSLLGSGISSAVSSYNQDKYINYLKEYNQQVFDREDTSYQRAVADAQAAGLSPLVAAGISAGDSGGVASAPEYNNDQASIAMQGFQGVAQALQGIAESDYIKSMTEKNYAEADDLRDQKGHRARQLSLEERRLNEEIMWRALDRNQQAMLNKANNEVQVLLKRMGITADELARMDAQKFEQFMQKDKYASEQRLQSILSSYEVLKTVVEKALDRENNAASQELAYILSKKDITEFFDLFKNDTDAKRGGANKRQNEFINKLQTIFTFGSKLFEKFFNK